MISLVEIARLVERRQALGTADVASESEPIAGGMMCFSGAGSWSNQASGLGLEGPVSTSEIDRLVNYFTSRGVEPQIDLTPFSDKSLMAGLEDKGFTLREFENVLYREISPDENLRSALPHPWAGGLTIEQVDPNDAAGVDEYVRLSWSGFIPEGEQLSENNYQIGLRMFEGSRTAAFTARIGGVAAGAGAMEVTAEISGLFGTSVLPEYRRRGIQAALIARRLEHARDHGCPLAAIHSKPGIPTERNAMRLGFKLAYSKAIMRMRGEGLLPSP